MKLIAAQIELLEATEVRLLAEIDALLSRKNGDSSMFYGSSNDDDFDMNSRIAMLNTQIKQIQLIKNGSEVVESSMGDVIDLGASFKLELDFGDGDIDEVEAVMIESRVTTEGSGLYVSIDSAIGSNIIGKSVGEEFTYVVNGISNKGRILEVNHIGLNEEKAYGLK